MGYWHMRLGKDCAIFKRVIVRLWDIAERERTSSVG
jgi:hypothetical protein